jgi:DNA-binding HxlR family transcriptional regulator
LRAGTYALSLLAVPLNVQVLRALEQEQTSLIDLRRAVGSPPQTTMRSHLRTLSDLGILERRRQNEFPGSLDYELTRPGREFLAVATLLQAWLADSPQGPISLGSDAAKRAVKALIDGWSSAIVRALAARPLSLTDLNRLIASHNYPSLERRLAALRLTGQIEAQPGKSRATPYAVTGWLRRSVAPLAAAARWERQHNAERTKPIARMDIESAFLLAVPLAKLSPEATGTCLLAVEVRNGGSEPGLAGVQVGIREGQVVSCLARLEGQSAASISGTASSWITAVTEADVDGLEVGGESDLGWRLLGALNEALFRVKQGQT